MKLPCYKLSFWLTTCLFALTATSRAVVINLDFNGATSGTNGVTYTGQGALATADVHFWNGVADGSGSITGIRNNINSGLSSPFSGMTPRSERRDASSFWGP